MAGTIQYKDFKAKFVDLFPDSWQDFCEKIRLQKARPLANSNSHRNSSKGSVVRFQAGRDPRPRHQRATPDQFRDEQDSDEDYQLHHSVNPREVRGPSLELQQSTTNKELLSQGGLGLHFEIPRNYHKHSKNEHESMIKTLKDDIKNTEGLMYDRHSELIGKSKGREKFSAMENSHHSYDSHDKSSHR